MIGACLIFLPPLLVGQENFNHPELEWSTIETAHFLLHFHEGAARTAQVVAKIAEEVYEPVTALYHHEPDQKVSFVISDYDDISNGAAYFYDNKIEIYAPSMDFDFRGTHNWLRNVVTHEFTHIVQIQTAMKFGRTLPAFYLQLLGYEAERRPDVLYGYPNVIVSTPYSGFVIPAWFAEGVAQYNRKELRYDFWDTHRDMILRSYALDGNMLSWDEMSVFGKTSLGNESSYNAGFAFVHYIAQRYGEEKLAQISQNLGSLTEVTIDGAIEEAVGKDGREVYDEWRQLLTEDYRSRVAPIQRDLRGGTLLRSGKDDEAHEGADPTVPSGHQRNERLLIPAGAFSGPCCSFNATKGFANLYPSYSPDGKHIAYVTTKEADYFSQSALYLIDLGTGEEERIMSGVRTGVSWSPDGKHLFYGKSTRDNPHWSQQFDIYGYDLEKKEEVRVTHGRRALSPSVSPDGTSLVFVVSSDGTTNLATSAVDGSRFQIITPFVNGEQVYSPRWSPAGDRILFDYSIKDGRDIAWVRPDGSDLESIVSGVDDSRSGVFSSNGSRIIFASDRTGVFNLYSRDVETGATFQLTNVLGGAFMPSTNPVGDIVYAGYTSGGYKLSRLESPKPLAEGDHHYVVSSANAGHERSGPLAIASNGLSTPQFDWEGLRSYSDTTPDMRIAKPYRSKFTSLSVIPFVRIDNYNTRNTFLETIKAGAYLTANDILDKTGFFAGAAFNTQLERDLFLNASYRGKVPLLYTLGLEPTASVELYNVTRKTNNFFSLGLETVPVDVTYNLFEFDFVLDQPFVTQFSNVEFRYIHSRYTSVLESFVLPTARVLVPASSDLYLIANDLSLTFRVDAISPSRTGSINPVGRKIKLRVGREFNKFNGNGEYAINSDGGLSPVYRSINFTRGEILWKEHIPFFVDHHTVTLLARGGMIAGPPVDDFFDFYAGGLPGLKGYPFYSLGGNEFAIVGLTYRFPLITNIDLRVFNFYFDKLYGSVYADIGNAWTGDVPGFKQFKTDAGAELRLESFSFYSFPTRIFFNASYGFDRFTRFIPSQNTSVTYGKEWRLYFGVLFDFDLD